MKPFPRPDSPNLYVWINCWDAKKKMMVRKQRSLGTNNPKEALKEAYRLQGIEDAKERAAANSQKVIRQICADYVASLVGINPDSTVRNYTNCLEICLEALGEYADRTQLDANVGPKVRQWLYQHYSGHTIEDRGRFCKRMLKHCIKVTGGDLWWLDDFIVDLQSDGDESPRAMFTNEQVLALRNACETDEEKAFLRFAENLGERIGDGLRFRASNYNPKTGLFKYLNTKTGKICVVWLWPENQKYIQEIIKKSEEKDPYLFPSFNFGVIEDVQAAAAWFAKILKKADIRNDEDLIPVKTGLTKVPATSKMRKRKKRYLHSFHSYRVRVISVLASLGVPFHIIMAIVGHKDPRTTRRYIRTLDEDVRSASMLLGSGSQGEWQQMAEQSVAFWREELSGVDGKPVTAKPLPAGVAVPDPAVPALAAPVPTSTPVVAPASINVSSSSSGPGVVTHVWVSVTPQPQSPQGAPDPKEGVFSAKTMHKDTIMLSSVPKGWSGLKPK